MGSLAIPNPYIMGVNSYSIGDGEELLVGERKEAAKHTLSLTEQLQFARQITLGMVSCVGGGGGYVPLCLTMQLLRNHKLNYCKN